MPVIQQENGVKSVKGLPLRWGILAYNALKTARGDQKKEVPETYRQLSQLLDQITDSQLPIDATDAQLCIMAERCANECASFAAFIHDKKKLAAKMAEICIIRGIQAHQSKCGEPGPVISRCVDAAWWRRQLRKVHGRHHEHAAIRLGVVSSQKGMYCSDEAVKRRIAQNRRNANALKATTMTNQDTGEILTLDVVASKGTGNKKIRRGELMLRLAGCDQIALELGHEGIFVTLTCPSKYHAVLEKSGRPNPHYNGASPIDAQRHLNEVWQLTRAQNARDGIAPYGFRIAEPHHDGCTHWHGLFFMPPEHVATFTANLTAYATAEDKEELKDGNGPRIKCVPIDRSEGGAAGYLAKYVGKNIGENDVREDMFGNPIITKEMRVDAWAGVWGIRQFQAIGQPPVTVWRELRRVPVEHLDEETPEHIKQAHAACQRVTAADPETGEQTILHAANWGEYLKAQGGINQGRNYRIALHTEPEEIKGRYGLNRTELPKGIFCKSEPGKPYLSIRYTWKKSVGGAAFDFPWSPVNNCTSQPHWQPTGQGEMPGFDDSDWFDSLEAEQVLFADSLDLESETEKMRQFAESGRWPERKAQPIRQETEQGWDFSRRYYRGGEMDGKLIKGETHV